MTRLVNAMREGIIERMMAHSFAERIAVLQVEQARLANACYNRYYNPTTRKKIDELPKGWLNGRNYITIVANDSHMSLYFNGDFNRFGSRAGFSTFNTGLDEINRRFPNCDHGTMIKFEPGDKLGDEIIDWHRSCEATQTDWYAARKQLNVTLDRFHTVEKLIEEWPEIAPFVDEKDKPAPVTAVALPVADLNSIFKLPVNADADQ